MIAHPELLTTAQQIEELARALRKTNIISYDTEFIRESTFYPVVEIIQIATDQESWLVDAQAFIRQREALRPLLDVFEDRNILKIAHAIQGDQECLYTSFGVVATPCIDTAIAASLCGYGDGIGLGNLIKAVLGVTLKKGHARTNWSVRPLPAQLLEYAHADVEYLVEVWRRLEERLNALDRRAWAFELSSKWEDKSLYESDPEGIAAKLASSGRLDKKSFSALLELVRWREERVRQLNLPRRWLADDHVLVDLARVRPKDIAHLGTFRGLNKGELRNSGETILAAIKRGAESAEVAPPKVARTETPSASEGQVLDLLKCYIGILADQHEIAVRHLISSSQLLSVLRSGADGPEVLVQKGLLTEGAARLIGAEVIALLQGQRALSVQGRAVKVVCLSDKG